ncbi:class F sortase [Streptomyces sp. AV19]|uniref:class F sortase n=1 Tax=Streptomyces sp. AV19 TaxID=2793068 RepID=UPI0018FF0A9F|nr:class F sortase [Streptomyces sp. AV19]MBH1936926.1 class F sortase [Streptomyces sp. AV19]MDG4532969.1 class F sortase [Streptomyces sp. AV19]
MSEKRTGGFGRLLTGAAWLALLLALWLWGHGIAEEPISTAPLTGDVKPSGRPPAHGLPPAHPPLPGAGPQALAIRALGLRAPIEGHGLDPRGGVEPPADNKPQVVAWYKDGPEPGTSGAAVLVGHVDTKTSRAVFYELSSVRTGMKVTVSRADGTTAEFTVSDVAVVPKEHFDADRAYGPKDTKRAELRLVTCGGEYDRQRHEYTANVVVSAYLTGAGRTQPPAKPPAPLPAQTQEADDEGNAEETDGS